MFVPVVSPSFRITDTKVVLKDRALRRIPRDRRQRAFHDPLSNITRGHNPFLELLGPHQRTRIQPIQHQGRFIGSIMVVR